MFERFEDREEHNADDTDFRVEDVDKNMVSGNVFLFNGKKKKLQISTKNILDIRIEGDKLKIQLNY